MARTLLRQLVTLAMPLMIGSAGLFGLGLWRRAEDTRWCRAATAASEVAPGAQAEPENTFEHQRSACAVHRQRQRVMLGSVWRTGGEEMAACGFDLARLQLLSDPQTRDAILAPHGLDSSSFDAGSRQDQARFIRACEANGPGGAR